MTGNPSHTAAASARLRLVPHTCRPAGAATKAAPPHRSTDMRIIETRVADMHYDPDFGRVEAAVTLIVKPQAGQPARRLRLRTNVPLKGARPLEERLAEDAVRLARAMEARPQQLPAPQSIEPHAA
jgi:hypothetical protein